MTGNRLHIDETAKKRIEAAEACLIGRFSEIDAVARENQLKVLEAFQHCGVSARHFSGTTGYGYGDDGRDVLDALFARVFGSEDALVRAHFVSGTHAISACLFALLRPGDTLVSGTGRPYDTLNKVIGHEGAVPGSLAEMGVKYREVALRPDGRMDVKAIVAALDGGVRVVAFQRSRGYDWRPSFSVAELGQAIAAIKEARSDVLVLVDNCYGEFVELSEPTEAGADVIVGSLIKNPGGGLAPTGAYVAGKKACVERIAARLTSPGIGREVGSSAAGYLPYYQGLFLAPHVVAQSLKTAVLFAEVFGSLGYDVIPDSSVPRTDIIQAVRFGDQKALIAFCRAIQKAAPVDARALPEPWDMPGYADPVIMAAGTFIQGASIELSADAPIREPYIAYFQGGLTYEHGRIAAMLAVGELAREGVLGE
jgi:cystathionine beta-lyase family protein involved in aluminum resistance